MSDAAAIAEAASRPFMRFVAVRSAAQQAAGMDCRTRDLLVRQRIQTINALRAHLAEQGIVAPSGPAHDWRLTAIIDGDDGMLPVAVRDSARHLLDHIAGLTKKISGVGVVTAAAITTFPSDGDLLEESELRRLERQSRDNILAATRSARPHFEDGPARHSAVADRRGLCRSAMGRTEGRSRWVLPGTDDGPQPKDAGRGGAGQSNGAHSLGAAAQG